MCPELGYKSHNLWQAPEAVEVDFPNLHIGRTSVSERGAHLKDSKPVNALTRSCPFLLA